MPYTYNDIRLTYNSTLSTYNGADYYLPINQVDSIVLSEDSQTELNSDINQFDILNINEDISFTGQLGGINQYDQLAIYEFLITATTWLGDINSIDTVNISENLSRYNILMINNFDEISITEFITTSNTQLGDISRSDVIYISENITSFAELADIMVDSSADISETLYKEMTSFISKDDQISISENITNSGQSSLSASDFINISENINSLATLANISQISSISIEDNLHPELQSNIHSSDQIVSNETVSMESFRFSPSDVKPLGRLRTGRPTDGKISGFF